MDAGVAAIIAAGISTAVGGTLGFLSSFLTQQYSLKHTRRSVALPRQMDSAQFAATVLFRTMSGDKVDQTTWDEFIASTYWLPSEVRVKCLSVLSNKDRATVLDAEKSVIGFCDLIIKGE